MRLPSSVPRSIHRLLTAGIGLVAGSGAIGLLGALILPGRVGQPRLAALITAGIVLGGLSLGAGLLRLPELTGDRADLPRLLLDALVVATTGWLVCWLLLSGAGDPTTWCGPLLRPVLLINGLWVVATLGLAAVLTVRAGRRWRRAKLLGWGTSLTAAAGPGFLFGACRTRVGTTLAFAVLAAGLLLVTLALREQAVSRREQGTGREHDPPARPATGSAERAPTDARVGRRDLRYTLLPLLVVAAVVACHRLWTGRFEPIDGIAVGVVGSALAARHYLLLRELRGRTSQLVQRARYFRELAYSDPLTGLANRRGLQLALHQQAADDSPYALLSLDLDGFKAINDRYGHDAGDAVLVEVAGRLRTNLRPHDLAARLGGDEFAVLMAVGPAEARRIAERLTEVLSRPYHHAGGRTLLSVSIGVAGHTQAADGRAVLHRADLALCYAKGRGKNRVEYYDDAYDELLDRRGRLERALRGAVERGELYLTYQPVVAVPTLQPVGAEALLRWHHPELGGVRAEEFLPVARECGLGGELGSWALHQTCHQLSRWLADGHDVWVSVNVAPRELHEPEYALQVAEALRAHRVPPQRLVLEFTESSASADLDELIRRLRALRRTGVRIALDGFGAGCSSLVWLQRLPIDILKVDRSLLGAAELTDPTGGPLLDLVLRLGDRLGLEVIAEGVGNRTELATLVEAGCRLGQGQLFGWSVPAERLGAMFTAGTSYDFPSGSPYDVPAGWRYDHDMPKM